ncbi:MAG: Rne/Rng family ribonuclease [Rhizobiaceae bacterium]
MPNKMLIDASHPEETRVVVVRGSRIEEFDFESQDKKQLRGNIYLARVTRVEPSLQAAFVEYGGNRHGFLAFNEIHPDYYQIPVADRQALLQAEAAQARADDEDDDAEEGSSDRQERRGRRKRRGRGRDGDGDQSRASGANDGEEETTNSDSIVEVEAFEVAEAAVAADVSEALSLEVDANSSDDTSDSDSGKSIAAAIESDVISEPPSENLAREISEDSEIESVGADDALEESQSRRRPMRRQYKIQEVIKRRQILLVQVVKEERGNKGAAMTTYLSLAGRYSVLMPNTARGGGISRKITSAQDRKRLKEVVKDLDVPEGMGVILRTAGENRTKAEIKRDYEYLMRMWENVRSLTLKSTAPALVYEEGSLIKRSVRDLYNKDINEILVAGDEGYREAKDFMRMLMPSHAKVVQPYRDTTPIFARNGIEAQLDRMLQPQVTLKSGGYIIINQTEALVAIDVNSGRSTKEHSIEDTALQTNLEAAEEVARQLRLRDLAGLIVIDFIDMEENRNNRSVEKRLKDHLKNDRARIQVGRISHFGLMEMSRQRIRASVLDSTMKPCPHCGGTGHIRSDSSVALLVVRAIEEFLLKDSRHHLTVRTPSATALYVLNHKRSTLTELEHRFGLTISIEVDETLGAQHYSILRGAVAEKPAGFVEPTSLPAPVYDEPDDIEEELVFDDEEAEVEAAKPEADVEKVAQQDDDQQRDRKRRRRRRRRGGRDRDGDAADQNASSPSATEEESSESNADSVADTPASEETVTAADQSGDGERKKRRRGKRGGKRNRKDDETDASSAESASDITNEDTVSSEVMTPAAETADGQEALDAHTGIVDLPPVDATDEKTDESPAESAGEVSAPAPEEAPAKPKRASRAKKPAKTASPDEKPARKPRASRKKVAEATTTAEASPTVTEPSPDVEAPTKVAVEVVDQPAEAPAATDAAPEVTEVQVTSTHDDDNKPKKGGWWQRSKSFF